ncbi:MAG: TetR/AcrR family transcriptional regulator [Oscillospiraceae bacterium]|nr:TetR/AcrR family transcriptional regulator [Oscillospiraceae bacterium]
MPNEQSELEKRQIHRPSSEEAKRISRECLQIAMLQLLSEKDLNKISITELVGRAGVSRATFYRNYSSKDELLLDISNDGRKLFASFLQVHGTREEIYSQCLSSFRMMKENEGSIRNIFNARITLSAALSLHERTEKPEYADVKRRYLSYAFEGAIMFIVKEWVTEDMRQSPEEMAEICTQILSESAARTLFGD